MFGLNKNKKKKEWKEKKKCFLLLHAYSVWIKNPNFIYKIILKVGLHYCNGKAHKNYGLKGQTVLLTAQLMEFNFYMSILYLYLMYILLI